MRRPTLPLIATSAVLGTMAIAVPALAASGSPTAHTARARHCSTVIVISHGRRTRACLVQGPRGFTGFPGAKGTTGKTGKTGATGKTGPAGKNGTNGTNGAPGAPGTVVASAIVQPSGAPPAANLINPSNVASVSEPSTGIYCITTTPGVSLAPVATVSPEVSYGTIKAPGLIAVNSQHTNCPATPYEVDTYTPGTTTLATGYAFTVVIP
jgi:Collagen triple helix repeat (20 copies)